MRDFVEKLGWLLPPPEEFRRAVKDLKADTGPVDGRALARLADYGHDLDGLNRLSKAIEGLGERLKPAPLSPLRLAVLAEGTADLIIPALRATAPRHGVLLDLYVPAYGQAMQEALNPASGLAAAALEAALVALDHRALGLGSPLVEAEAAASAVSAALSRVEALFDGLARAGVRSVVAQTLPVPPDPWCGHLDRVVPGSPSAQIAAFNEGLVDLVRERGATLFDVAALAELVGRSRWFDDSLWHRAKVPFDLNFAPLYADHAARLFGAMRGKSRKCLVLDLDNTLWGGVIGDDGLEGIRLGQGSADGEAFLAIQRMALALKARGVVLAVVSKNEEDAARLPFQKHPEMLLKEEDIAVFIANWADKASNIRHVANVLNIGVDALAFLDDNPAERARVRQMLPEVAVPELPEDPALYPAALMQSGVFETIGLSADDAKRAEQYRANAARAVAMEKIGDYDEYLRSLEMLCDIRPFDAVGRTRIAQLVNKSNQFNLTTRRRTEAEIAVLEADENVFDLQVRLADRFGDNGMISVVIFRKGAEEWLCDTWLMSCRVLERRVEEAVLSVVVAAARAAGAKRLVGEYLPTAKNRMVADHFEKLGFAPAGAAAEPGPEGPGTRWILSLEGWSPPALPMKVHGPKVPVRAAERAL